MDSVGVNSKEQLFKLTLEVREVFSDILVSLTAIMSKFLFAHFNKYIRSSKFLFNEHERERRKRETSLFGEISMIGFG